MEIINLSCLFLFLYLIFSISFINKFILLISFCSLTNCYIKRLELVKSKNILVNCFGKIICFFSDLFDLLYEYYKMFMKTNIYKSFYNILNQLNNYYIDGKTCILNKIKENMNIMIEKQNENNNMNKPDKRVFENDNDMFDFLNELDSDMGDKEKKNI
jgi:hypothetical protein